MTRWLWVWFLAILSFPVVPSRSARPAVVPRAARLAPVSAEATAGPLVSVVDGLQWVGDRRPPAVGISGHPSLVEFWAFACVNCQRSVPAMRALERRYRDTNVRIVAIHTPELPVERDAAGVASAVKREGIDYPVALDPDSRAWTAFGNQYWPCLYLLDARGRVRYRHVGELHQDTPAWSELLQEIESLRGTKA